MANRRENAVLDFARDAANALRQQYEEITGERDYVNVLPEFYYGSSGVDVNRRIQAPLGVRGATSDLLIDASVGAGPGYWSAAWQIYEPYGAVQGIPYGADASQGAHGDSTSNRSKAVVLDWLLEAQRDLLSRRDEIAADALELDRKRKEGRSAAREGKKLTDADFLKYMATTLATELMDDGREALLEDLITGVDLARDHDTDDSYLDSLDMSIEGLDEEPEDAKLAKDFKRLRTIIKKRAKSVTGARESDPLRFSKGEAVAVRYKGADCDGVVVRQKKDGTVTIEIDFDGDEMLVDGDPKNVRRR